MKSLLPIMFFLSLATAAGWAFALGQVAPTNQPRIHPVPTRAVRLALTAAPTPVNTLDVTSANFPVSVRDTGVTLIVIDSLHQVWVGNKIVGTVTKNGWVAAP